MIIRDMPVSQISPDDGSQYWIGYYDKQPWSSDGTRVLCHRAGFLDHYPRKGETCDIGFVSEKRFVSVATSGAWNWQQGSHLRWSDVPGRESLMFNDLDELGRPVSRWVTIDGEEIHRIDSPIYAVTPDGMTGLTLDFGRLTRLRPEYGYPALSDSNSNIPAPDTEGLWRVDLQTGERTLIASIADFAKVSPGDTDLTAPSALHQHINHIMVNPSGTRCCLLHRYDREDGILQSRLFTVPLDGSDKPRLLLEGMVSHYDWQSDQAIIAWGGQRKLLGSGNAKKSPKARLMTIARRTLKPVYYAMGKPRFLMNKVMGDSYTVIPDRPDPQLTTFAKGELICDGHNTFYRGSSITGSAQPDRWMVTDGYPDMKSKQPLYLWDLIEDQGYEIGRYFTPKELDGDIRIDLHPRFSRDGNTICIDSGMNTNRAIYAIDISQITATSQSEPTS